MKSKNKSKAKKPYLAPRVESRDIYEVNALGCAKCVNAGNISVTSACVRGTKKYS